MSDAMFPSRIYWRHTLGIARHGGVSAELKQAPPLPGMDCMTELDYIPQVMAQVRIGCEKVRDMTAQEQADAMAYLCGMHDAVRAYLVCRPVVGSCA